MLKSALRNATNFTTTENGAVTNISTQSHVLDLFANGAVISDKSRLSDLIKNALYEDRALAIKVIFNLADIRQGQGRRAFFKMALDILVETDMEVARKLLAYIPEFGRWDYLYWFLTTPLATSAMEVMRKEIMSALKAKRPSLVFKWMASEDASSKETKRNATVTRLYLQMSPKQYRKMLSSQRKLLKDAVVERNMSLKKWEEIDYSKVCGGAMKKYRKAFNLHSPEKFTGFIKKVQTGETKINSSVLYPYDIIQAGMNSYTNKRGSNERAALVEQFKALPNYITKGIRALPIIDTSGSMGGLPLMVAGSFGLYLSSHYEGEFNNCFITFSAEAKLVELPNGDIFDKYEYFVRNSINENTNLQSVFDLLLTTAKEENIPAEEMPNRLIIVSDMEFDAATDVNRWAYNNVKKQSQTNLSVVRQKYLEAGYEFPQIIFWTVDNRTKQVPATMNDQGVILVGGYSPSTLKSVLSDDPYITPYKAMLETINVERYAFVDSVLQ